MERVSQPHVWPHDVCRGRAVLEFATDWTGGLRTGLFGTRRSESLTPLLLATCRPTSHTADAVQLTGRQVAIKRVGKVFTDCVDAKRILREINLLRYLGNHENIVELIDLMTYPPDSPKFRDLYIVTQLYECDLERIVASPQKLTEAHLQYFIYQVRRI